MQDELLGRFLFRNLDGIRERWEAIHRYNATIADRLPVGAKTLAFAEWHYNASDPRCPHDSWIQSIELKTADTFNDLRGVLLLVLGAYHDRLISFDYSGVTDFEIQGQLVHGPRRLDWLYDELHLTESGEVEHLIELELCVIGIRCADLTVTQLPIKDRDRPAGAVVQ
jgi:hypothetical protein